MADGPHADAGTYRLAELGWLHLERLADAVLGLDPAAEPPDWTERADRGRVGMLASSLTLPGRDPLPGPVLVLVDDGVAEHHWIRRVRALAGATPQSVLVLTTRSDGDWETVLKPVGRASRLVLDPVALGALIDASQALRERVPALLGVREPGPLGDVAALARSTADLDAAGRLARVFVATSTYSRALAVLSSRHLAVITGPPEMGKTAIARTIALTRSTLGWEAHECADPTELWALHDPGRPQVFVADDLFGSTEYRPDAAERWARELDRVLRALDDEHWLVWTSRPAPLKAALERLHRGADGVRVPRPAEVHVDAARLDLEDKAAMLFRHAGASPLTPRGVALVQAHGSTLVRHSHFTPERIRRFVRSRLPELEDSEVPVGREDVAEAVAREIHEPTVAMTSSLEALEPEYRELLVALLDTPPGPVAERDLAAAARRHLDHGLRHRTADLVERLADHFLRLVPPQNVTWVHPSWRDLVIDHVAADADARRRFLSHCSLDGLLLALSVGGGTAGERRLPFLVDDADWDVGGHRLRALAVELDDHDLIRLLAALEAAVSAPGRAEVRREVLALAGVGAEVVREQLNARHDPLPLALVETWYDLAELLGADVAVAGLALGPTWIELLPTASLRSSGLDDLERTEEWLRLCDVLVRHDPDALGRFGVPAETAEALRRLVDEANELSPRRLATPPGRALAACAIRLSAGPAAGRLFEHPPVPHPAIVGDYLRQVVPADDDVPAVLPGGSEEDELVSRVLADLRPSV